MQCDAINRRFRFQPVIEIFANRHLSAIGGEKIGHREAAFVDVSYFANPRLYARTIRTLGNESS